MLTAEKHYQVIRKGKKFYFEPTDKDRWVANVGSFNTAEEALEAAQHFENEYHKHKKK